MSAICNIPFTVESSLVSLLRSPLMKDCTMVIDGAVAIHTFYREKPTLSGFLNEVFGHDGPYPVNSELFIQLATHDWERDRILVLVLGYKCLSCISSCILDDTHNKAVVLHSPYKRVRENIHSVCQEFTVIWLLKTSSGYIGISDEGVVNRELDYWSLYASDTLKRCLENGKDKTSYGFLLLCCAMGRLDIWRTYDNYNDLFEPDNGSLHYEIKIDATPPSSRSLPLFYSENSSDLIDNTILEEHSILPSNANETINITNIKYSTLTNASHREDSGPTVYLHFRSNARELRMLYNTVSLFDGFFTKVDRGSNNHPLRFTSTRVSDDMSYELNVRFTDPE